MQTSLQLLSNSIFGRYFKSTLLGVLLLHSQVKLYAQADNVIFKDDFSQNTLGSNWQANSFWAINNGVAYNSYDIGTLLTIKAFSAPSYVIETTAKGFSYAYGRQFHFTFGQATDSISKAYVLSYFPGGGGQLRLGRATDNIFFPENLDQAVIYPEFEFSRWQKFKIARYKSGLIQVYVDKGTGYSSLPVLEAIDSTYPQLGHIGWTVSTQTGPLGFTVDHIDVRIPDVEKPAVREKPAEDDLIAKVVATNNKPYTIAKLKTGAKPYSDRDYTVTSLPAYLQNASFIQTANNDKYNRQSEFLAVFIKKAAIAYVAYDSRAAKLPDWLLGWDKTNDVIQTTDTKANYLAIYSKVLDSGLLYPRLLALGGNLAVPAIGAETNYLVAVVERPAYQVLEAEEATIVGGQIATNHAGYSGTGFVDFINKTGDYVEWTVQTKVPGTYALGFVFANGSLASRSMAVIVDGKEAGIQTFAPFDSWETWPFDTGIKLYLTLGQHKIRLVTTGASGPNLDLASLSFRSSVLEPHTASKIARKAPGYPEKVLPDTALKVTAYPNPFETTATFTYFLPEEAAVQLTLYNQQGQKMKIVADEVQPAGWQAIHVNGVDLPKGLYLYRLQTKAKSVSGKIIRK